MSKDKHRNTKQRQWILDALLVEGRFLPVNCKYNPQTKRKQSAPLQWLLKRGKVKLARSPTTGRKSGNKRQTYLVAS